MIKGDIVLNPLTDGLVCVIMDITDRYFILSPMTKRGHPSKNQRLWQWYNFSYLKELTLAAKLKTLKL